MNSPSAVLHDVPPAVVQRISDLRALAFQFAAAGRIYAARGEARDALALMGEMGIHPDRALQLIIGRANAYPNGHAT